SQRNRTSSLDYLERSQDPKLHTASALSAGTQWSLSDRPHSRSQRDRETVRRTKEAEMHVKSTLALALTAAALAASAAQAGNNGSYIGHAGGPGGVGLVALSPTGSYIGHA